MPLKYHKENYKNAHQISPSKLLKINPFKNTMFEKKDHRDSLFDSDNSSRKDSSAEDPQHNSLNEVAHKNNINFIEDIRMTFHQSKDLEGSENKIVFANEREEFFNILLEKN